MPVIPAAASLAAVSRRLAPVSDGLNRAVVAFCVGCVLVMLCISFAGFFYMITTGASLSWTYSLARLFIPWIGLLSITVAFKRGEHIAMTSLRDTMPRPVVAVLKAVNLVVLVLFVGLLIWYGTRYAIRAGDYYMVSDRIQIHARWVAAALPVTGLVMLVHILCGARLFDPPPLLEPEDVNAAPKQPLP